MGLELEYDERCCPTGKKSANSQSSMLYRVCMLVWRRMLGQGPQQFLGKENDVAGGLQKYICSIGKGAVVYSQLYAYTGRRRL